MKKLLAAIFAGMFALTTASVVIAAEAKKADEKKSEKAKDSSKKKDDKAKDSGKKKADKK